MEYNKDNFFLGTKAKFKGCKIPKRAPDYISYNQWGTVSSSYYYGSDKNGAYVIRVSDHWSKLYNFNNDTTRGCNNIASCVWVLKTNNIGYKRAGKCYFSDFKPI